ncbi:MAG TPA: M23 family metallopeptidase [Longimicrobium sp.]|nr:M23 family metallopeptidase [Longimicrobium sp.]
MPHFRWTILALALAVAAPLSAQSSDTAAVARGRTLTRLLLAGQGDSLAPMITPDFAARLGGPAGLTAFAGRIREQGGAEGDVVRELVFHERGRVTYYRVSRFSTAPVPLTTRWVWGADGRVLGMQVSPTPEAAATEHAAYQTKSRLRLPFDGEWLVVWGGRTPEANYHVIAPDQRFAYDLVALRGGATMTGEGKANEDYACWGAPIFAPAAGLVVVALDSVADNVPGTRNSAMAAGNHVVIDHGNGEFSFLAHLRRGSVAVKPGARVAAGAQLGVCGNSGNSTQPHLHYHLQNGSKFGEGAGLPAAFNDYRADDVAVPRGEPSRGERISTAPRR